jgi:peptidyl-prolyl cis-trans isomerase C
MSHVMNADEPLGDPGSARLPFGNRLRGWLRQPLLQFLVIGMALFALSSLVDDAEDAVARTILVDGARVQRLAELYRVQMGSAPSAAELEHLIEGHIRDEVLYREAMKMGLDRDDEIIRRRLVQKMEFLQNDLSLVAEPDDASLRKYFADHAAQFVTPATATFRHVYFSADSIGDEGARRAAGRQLADLPTTEDAIEAGLGDPFPLQQSYSALTGQETTQIFGRTPFVEAVFSAPEQQWSGPVRSGYGWHLIFVSRRVPSHPMGFEEARDRVRDAYIAEQRRAANEGGLARLRARYHVVRNVSEGGR